MGKYNELNSNIREIIDDVAKGFDGGVNYLSTERYLVEAKKRYLECRKKCRIANTLALALSAVIIYIHLRG